MKTTLKEIRKIIKEEVKKSLKENMSLPIGGKNITLTSKTEKLYNEELKETIQYLNETYIGEALNHTDFDLDRIINTIKWDDNPEILESAIYDKFYEDLNKYYNL